jgi:hypothetical protein
MQRPFGSDPSAASVWCSSKPRGFIIRRRGAAAESNAAHHCLHWRSTDVHADVEFRHHAVD